MAMKDRCPGCGALVLPDEKFCKQCGASLALIDLPDAPAAESAPASETTATPNVPPRTIEELRAWCELNGMSLEKMRFFIGENYTGARAFGIYRDGDNCVVYKNKSDGSRAVRYHGPDEAYGVKELYEKLLDECHKRDIWPDGKPEGYDAAQKKKKRRRTLLIVVAIIAYLAFVGGGFIINRIAHRHDGYYRFNDDAVYYRYGDTWYYDDDDYDWVAWSGVPEDNYRDYYVGDDYDDAWGGNNFKSSDTWERIQEERHTSSSDYSSWDSGDTDWDSDW